MAKNADGVWELMLGNPMLEEAKKRFNSELNSKDVVKKPRGIAQTLFGGVLALREALEDGSAWEDQEHVSKNSFN